jgi:hypothetical protein
MIEVSTVQRASWKATKDTVVFSQSSPISRVSVFAGVKWKTTDTTTCGRLRFRQKLPAYNTIADAVKLIHTSKRILILTGAGISKFDGLC